MNEGRLNLGVVNGLTAESFGEPGGRTFRLLATTDSGELAVWLEKEQLVALSGAVEQLLNRIPDDQGEIPRPVIAAAQISGHVSARAGSLSLGFDRTQNVFAIEASDLWEATLDVQVVLLLAHREQLTNVGKQLEEIIAAGRPRCTLCGLPLGPGPHFCPPSNGHAAVLSPGTA